MHTPETPARCLTATNSPLTVRDKTYWVYLLTNASSTVLYVGMTSELTVRMAQHQARTDPGSFTARYRTDRLVHAEPFRDVRDAIRREKQLKGWSRAKKRALIDAENPACDELAI
ncbi:MAG: hypothetical protein Rubg2KO_12670 [Rubricoccaceae bacterium]